MADPTMTEIATLFGTVLKEAPPVIFALLGCAVVWLLREPLLALVPHIRGFKAFGIEMTIGPDAEKAVDAAMTYRSIAEDAVERGQIKTRLQGEWTRLIGAQILWIDDNPFGNRYEARLLQRYGAVITVATSADDAWAAMRADQPGIIIDLILSDIGRPAGQETGIAFLHRLREVTAAPPCIFYVGKIKPDPIPGAVAIESRPDRLIARVLDALARRERPNPPACRKDTRASPNKSDGGS